MTVKPIEIGKWVKIVRISLLGNMSQVDFANWLSKETQETISSQLVARMENWGCKDTTKQAKPSDKVIHVLQSIAPWGPSSKVPVVRSTSHKMFDTSSSSQINNSNDNYLEQVYASGIGNISSPVYFYYPALWRPVIEDSTFRYSVSASSYGLQRSPFVIRVVSASSGMPLDNTDVIAFTSFTHRQGERGRTDGSGEVSLLFSSSSSSVKIEKLFVHSPLSGHWGFCANNLMLDSRTPYIVQLQEVSLPHPDGILNQFYSSPRSLGTETAVKVGVVDTGIDLNHPYLNVTGGKAFFYANNLTNELAPPSIYSDNGSGHGTHVAGIIGSSHPDCLGIAPNVEILSYRVFADGEHWESIGAQNNHIADAIYKAVNDRCDVINLSLGTSFPKNATRVRETVLSEACQYAYDHGTVIVAAAGNDSEDYVNIPACFNRITQCVTALGRERTIPPDTDAFHLLGFPTGSVPEDRFAAFSNYCVRGTDVQFIAPGVGVISTIPRGGFGVMSGTSMACPVVSGVAAYLLSHDPVVFSMSRDRNRTLAILELLEVFDHGFGSEYQGAGRPLLTRRPSV